MKNLLFILLTFVAISFVSCGSDDCSADDITAAVTKITDAATLYAEDASVDNCNAYKSALEDYISDLKDCDGVTQAVVDSYQTDIDGLTCE